MNSINGVAPVVAAAEIETAADPERVWELMTDFHRWPDWNGDVAWVSFEGDVVAGSRFEWKAGPGKIKSTLQYVDKPRLLVWKGKTLGIRAIHVWRIEPHGSGSLLATEESWEGMTACLFRRIFRKMLQNSVEAWLVYLRDEAERRAGQ
jgi:uncharacterized protein YndB with AHSA1/START domain